MQTEHFFSPNSGEDQKKGLPQEWNTFFPQIFAQLYTHSNYWGGCRRGPFLNYWGNTAKLLGGYIPPSPPGFGTTGHHASTYYACTSAFIPHDILKRPSVVSVAARLNITPLQQTALTKAVIEEAGDDPRHVAKSHSIGNKARQSTAKVILIVLRASGLKATSSEA